MPLGERGLHERGGERGASLLKRLYSIAIGSSNVRTAADRHRHAAYHNKHWHELLRNVNIDDLE